MSSRRRAMSTVLRSPSVTSAAAISALNRTLLPLVAGAGRAEPVSCAPAARIDRLPAAEEDLLQTLAVVGRQAPLAVIMEIVARPQLLQMLANLQTAEFIYEQAGSTVAYEFKHALTQDVAYSSLLMERRKVLHGRVGATIESVYW